MAEAYSGLRRRRKRTHPSKCPCCTDDVEPENEGSAGNEELHDANSKREVGHKQNKRRKIVKKKDIDYKSDSDVSDHDASTAKDQKRNLKNLKLRSSRNSSLTSEREKSRDTGKAVNKNGNDKNKVPKTNNGKKGSVKKEIKGNGKNSISLQKSALEDVSDDEISQSSLKASRSKKKKTTSMDSESSGKKKNSTENKKESNKKKSFEINNKKSKIQENSEPGLDTLENENIRAKNGNGRKTGNKKASKGKVKKISTVAYKSSMVVGDGLAKEVIQPRKSRVKNIVLSSKVSQITQVKSMVFDHLFEELKSFLGNDNLSVKEAGDMLIKISAEDLKLALRSTGLGASLEQKRFDGTKNQETSLAEQERKAISDTEEIVSQAAEALVSFRSKSPLSREIENKEENNAQNPVSTSVATKTTNASSVLHSFGESRKLNPSVVTAGSLSSTQALMQIQTSSVLSPQIFQTHVTTSPSQTLVQGQGYLTVSLHQQLSQPPPTGMNTSFTSMMPMVASHGALPSFSQIAAQLRPPLQSVQTPLFSAGSANPTAPTSVMLPTPNLVQPHIQKNVSIPNLVGAAKLQGMAAIKTTGAPVEAAGSKGAPTQKQILPQQPLKGMEEVVGNVGSVGANVPPIVWNLKSPVVFLGSPQNLGGVPRNLMTTSTNQGVNVNPNKDQPGYPPVAPRPGSSSDGMRINPGTATTMPAPNVLTLGGRPILPRTQPRSVEDASNKRPQPMAAQSSLAFVTQQAPLGSTSIFPVQSSTSAVLGQGTMTQVSSALNPARTGLVAMSLPSSSLQVSASIGNLTSQNVSDCAGGSAGGDCSSPTSVTAKQAVKKLVHERTKTAELRREATTKLKTILPSPPKPENTTVTTTSNAAPLNENPDPASKSSEFNIEQAATALLSIGVPDGGDMLKSSLSDALKEDPEEDVVFTSKGVFRVGDVDVDPHYNRIGREGYICGKCNKIFTSLSYLARHIKRVCPDMSCRKWKCSMCDKAFRHPFGLQQHVYTHTGERPHKCPICPKAFYSSNDLRRHSRIHSGERPYTCKHCDKSFATTISLKTHTYIHTGEKPHKCPQCPKTFATSSKLGRHIVTHSEQRPYSCDQCPKSFNRSGDLRRHNMAVHEGKEKAFECEVCSMSFTKSADLRRHSATHNPKPPKTMECADCGTQFSTPICMKMHRETYHKTPATTAATSTDTEKPSTCDICGKTYSSATLLVKHKATHEPTSTAGYDASQFQHIAPKPIEQTSDTPTG